jgi:hypothetical protein
MRFLTIADIPATAIFFRIGTNLSYAKKMRISKSWFVTFIGYRQVVEPKSRQISPISQQRAGRNNGRNNGLTWPVMFNNGKDF